jgi:hypothetical protein
MTAGELLDFLFEIPENKSLSSERFLNPPLG